MWGELAGGHIWGTGGRGQYRRAGAGGRKGEERAGSFGTPADSVHAQQLVECFGY